MKIILVITREKDLIENIPSIELKNHNVVVLSNVKYIRHYLEEYMPEYIILSAEFKNHKDIKEYISSNPCSELVVIDSEARKDVICSNIYLDGVKDINDLKKVLNIIDNLDADENVKIKNNYKVIPQQVISFYSIQGGVGKTSIVFNFAWYIKNIIEGKVLIIDLNFCEGPSDLSINLDLNLLPNLSVFIEKITSGENYFNNSITNLDSVNKIDILQPPLSIHQSDKFNIDMLDSVIYSARSKYDVIIADVPFRYDNISLEMLNLSTTSILVLSPDIKLIPRIDNFQKFLPEEQKKGIIFNKVSQINKPHIDEYKNILGIPVYGKISLVPEKYRELITVSRSSFNILNLQTEISNLINFIF